MSWARAPVADAIASVLTAASEGAVSVFAEPPSTFNPPAYIVAWADTAYDLWGVDVVTLSVLAAAPVEQSNQLDDLIHVARAALEADPTLGGVITTGTVNVTGDRNWRVVDVAGARVQLAELTLEIRM